MYGWKITRDYIYDPDDTTINDKKMVGTKGPRGLDPALEAELDAGKGDKFRMKDDDGNIYYHGRIVGDYDGFEPLDDFGMGWAGCTTIEYKNTDGNWEVL